jgi:tRNA pseudouridine13 synthase
MDLPTATLEENASSTTESNVTEVENKIPELILEESVGIQQYLHPEFAGISGIFKQKFSDFIVREITLDNEVIYLKSVDGRELEKSIFCVARDDKTAEGGTAVEPTDSKTIAEVILKEINQLFPSSSPISEEESEKFTNFLQQTMEKSTEAPSEFIGFVSSEKSIRSGIHSIIRKYAGSFLETTSLLVNNNDDPNNKNNSYQIQIFPKKGKTATSTNSSSSSSSSYASNQRRNNNKRKFDEWPKDCPDYLSFTVMKENIDTMNCVYLLGKLLKMKVDNIFFNGTKDKRAITTQRMTIYHRKPNDFNKINNYSFPPFFRCGDFQYVSKSCKLGQLAGNRFELVIRKISPYNITKDKLLPFFHDLQNDGFINYFGLQRFGKGGTASHILGKYLLQSNWKQCIHSLFAICSHDRKDTAEAKKLYEQKKYSEALSLLPENMISERLVLKSLLSYPEDYMNAFHKISKNIRLIYLHAYQSYLWNKAASERIKRYAYSTVIEGDLVLEKDTESSSLLLLEENIDEVTDEIVTEMNEIEDGNKMTIAEEEKTSSSSSSSISDGKSSSSPLPKIHIVTAEDVISKKYSISDVVLPLVGSEILFPHNDIGNYFHELLAVDSLSVDLLSKCHIIYRLKGGYRKLIEFPRNLEWELKEYQNDNDEINTTELNNFLPPRTKNDPTVSSLPTLDSTSEKGVVENTKKALLLKFSLSPGSYATMFLRELTKESTEFDYQTYLMNSKK